MNSLAIIFPFNFQQTPTSLLTVSKMESDWKLNARIEDTVTILCSIVYSIQYSILAFTYSIVHFGGWQCIRLECQFVVGRRCSRVGHVAKLRLRIDNKQ